MPAPNNVKGKLRPWFYGSYKVIEVVNPMAYKLELPTRSCLHNVFHISLLKKYVGDTLAAPSPLPPTHHGTIVPVLAHAIKVQMARSVRQVLVQLQGQPASAASWEDLQSF